MAAMHDIRNIVILTGAGWQAPKAESTFRIAGGLRDRYRPEVGVATPQAFARDPDLVLDMRRAAIQDKGAKPAHFE